MVNLDFLGTVISIASLVLAVVFWWLAKRQADKADTALFEIKQISNEVKDKMLSWQSDLNNAAIGLIQARPEVIAEKVSLEEAKSHTAFTKQMAALIETLAKEATEQSAGYKGALVTQLLEHHRQFVLGSEQIKAQFLASAAKAPKNQP